QDDFRRFRDLIYFHSERFRARNSFLYFRNSHNRRNSSHGSGKCSARTCHQRFACTALRKGIRRKRSNLMRGVGKLRPPRKSIPTAIGAYPPMVRNEPWSLKVPTRGRFDSAPHPLGKRVTWL